MASADQKIDADPTVTTSIEPSRTPSFPSSQLEAGQEKPVAIDPNIVDFDGPDDPYNALNWPMKQKVLVTALYSFLTMGATWASTAYNSGIAEVKVHFGVETEVALLGMSLFLFGNAFGPLLWAPMSEAFGRKYSILLPLFGLCLFSFATATAKDIQTVLITRFFGGVFGGAPLSNTGGVLADVWHPTARGPALLMWGLCITLGPMIAPIVGGALVISMPTVGWRWTEYVTGIILAVTLVASVIYIPESYPPVLLKRKANRLRLETGNFALHAASEEIGTSFGEMSRRYLIVPLEMLIDPIAFCINLYAAFTYAIIYLAVPAFLFEFQQVRHWNAVVSAVPFTAVIIGVIFGGVVIMWGAIQYKKKFEANGRVEPEMRLLAMMVGSVFFAAGLFIMGWTSDPKIHWIGFCVGSACLGLGFFAVFQSALGYLVDTYVSLAASVIAANMFMRSMLAGAFPLFATALFTKLGIDWGMSLLGFFAVAMLPIPYVFFIFGKRLRAMGKHSKKTFVA
ncbi:MFS general substrate transporter [Massarina eburnea CBS 473.64]|uniref:MFS general substrate transporter n=1 Tax=Massarina eburnea CBS 473.64 TaxID=1395130 RepID=A0A6A6RW26_9PLEO|nr:MFS general substrate transporter [Massarina eburnea CBS 473.64]